MGAYETANALAILSGARKPQWVELTPASAYTGAPDSAADGIYLENALHALLAVQMREQPYRRTARVTIGTLDLAATTYTVTINGTAHNVAPAFADRAAILTALVTAINGGAQAALVTATSVDEDAGIAGNDTLKIVGDVATDFTLDISVAGGTGTLAAVADPTTATLRVWFTARENSTTGPDLNAWLNSTYATRTLDWTGYVERFDVSGLDRCYLEIGSIDGAGDGASVTYSLSAWVGPCVTE